MKEIYEDPSNPLTWPTLLMTDGDTSFQGAFSREMQQYNITIRVVDLYSFKSLALIKSFKKNLAKLIYKVQYAIERQLAEGSDQGYGIKSLKSTSIL